MKVGSKVDSAAEQDGDYNPLVASSRNLNNDEIMKSLDRESKDSLPHIGEENMSMAQPTMSNNRSSINMLKVNQSRQSFKPGESFR